MCGEYNKQYGTVFLRTTYIFWLMEIYSIIVAGSTLIIVVLWRQLYPLKIDVGKGIYAKEASRIDFSRRKGATSSAECISQGLGTLQIGGDREIMPLKFL